jgi:lysylphosphatidylglycerol synthetase-like protein (DUF2156 family)
MNNIDESVISIFQNKDVYNTNITERPGLKLDLSKIGSSKAKPDFHEEFMSKLNEFSESWREAAAKERQNG